MDEPLPRQPAAPDVRRNSLPAVLIATAILGLSFLVQPDARGYGTHQRLLLPPCLFHLATGEPCPFCGMTTGFAHMARGEVVAAGHSNLMAPLGFVLTILALLGGLYGLLSGRAWLPQWVNRGPLVRAAPYAIGVFWAANLALRHLGGQPH